MIKLYKQLVNMSGKRIGKVETIGPGTTVKNVELIDKKFCFRIYFLVYNILSNFLNTWTGCASHEFDRPIEANQKRHG